jgi:hypothetical protein
MSTKAEKDAQPEALAAFAAAARNKGVKPAGQGISATAETSGKPGDLEAEEKDATDILEGERDRRQKARRCGDCSPRQDR